MVRVGWCKRWLATYGRKPDCSGCEQAERNREDLHRDVGEDDDHYSVCAWILVWRVKNCFEFSD